MKSEIFTKVAEYILDEELKKFEQRINYILDDLYCEVKDAEFDQPERYLYKMAIKKFDEYYPGEPFFRSVFNDEYTRWEIDLGYDDIGDPTYMKEIDRLKKRRENEIDWYL